MAQRTTTALATTLLLAFLAACGQPDAGADRGADPGEATPNTSATTAQTPLAEARAVGVLNAREPLPGLVTAGQPDQEQLRALQEAGFGTAVSLRPAGESGAGWEEAFASGRDLDFHRIAVAGPSDLSRENVEELDRILAGAGDGPVVLYCASSNRVGALLALRAHWLQGMEPEEALQLGREAGLTRLEPAVADLLGLEGS